MWPTDKYSSSQAINNITTYCPIKPYYVHPNPIPHWPAHAQGSLQAAAGRWRKRKSVLDGYEIIAVARRTWWRGRVWAGGRGYSLGVPGGLGGGGGLMTILSRATTTNFPESGTHHSTPHVPCRWRPKTSIVYTCCSCRNPRCETIFCTSLSPRFSPFHTCQLCHN